MQFEIYWETVCEDRSGEIKTVGWEGRGAHGNTCLLFPNQCNKETAEMNLPAFSHELVNNCMSPVLHEQVPATHPLPSGHLH